MPREQRFIFNEVAELYDRARPRYPQPLVDDVISFSGIAANGRILEVGCGTGQATLPFASRGFRMLCLEPGPALARLAREKLLGFPEVDVVPCTFEEWPLEAERFRLVISAQAFHWVAPELRFTKAAAALRAGGTLAVFGNAVVFERSLLREALDRIYALHASSMNGPSATRWYAEEGPIRKLFEDSSCFGPVTWRRYPWSATYTSTEYLDLLRTHSDHRLLPTDQREPLLRAVSEVIEIYGKIEVRYETHLYLARRAS